MSVVAVTIVRFRRARAAFLALALAPAGCAARIDDGGDPAPSGDQRMPANDGRIATVAPNGRPVVDAGQAPDAGRGPDAVRSVMSVADVADESIVRTSPLDAGVVTLDAGDPSATVLSLSVLHQIALQVDPALLPTLLADRTKRIPCQVTYDGHVLGMATAHRKGLTTGSSTKPSLVLKFDEVMKGQKLGGLDKLVLNNALQDPSFLNEHIGYEVFRMAGIAAPRTAHGLVTINGKAYGLYIVEEAMDKTFLAGAFGSTFKNGNLYEGSLRDFVASQSQGTWPNELDLKNEVEEMRSRADIRALAEIVKTASNADYEAKLSQKLDFKAFLTAFAVAMILGEWDDYFYASNNYYLYDNPRDGRFVLIPHSPDWLWSPRASFPTSKPDPTVDPFVPLASLNAGVGPGRMAARIREIPALEARLRAEVGRVIREVWDPTALQSRIDHVAATLHTNTRTDAKVLADIASFDKQHPVMRDLVVKRQTFMKQLTP